MLFPLLCSEREREAEFRLRKQTHYFKSINKADLNAHQSDGWEVIRENKTTFRVRKEKPHYRLLEDRIWCLFFKMGFDCLNGINCTIKFEMSNGKLDQKQIDVFACDGQTTIFVECKSSESRRYKNLRGTIAEIGSYKEKSRGTVSILFQKNLKAHPKCIWILATHNIFIS